MSKSCVRRPFPNAEEDARSAKLYAPSPQTESSAYQLAYLDQDFLLSDELRPVRLQLELLKPELLQQAAGIEHTIVVFGSARIPDPETAGECCEELRQALAAAPDDESLSARYAAARRAVANSRYYTQAREFTRLLSERCIRREEPRFVVITGGGPGIMEAANRGAHEAGQESIGLNIVLPMEQAPNPYVTPELCFQFHYFAIRKMHFLLRARALVAFPGGFGTLDELFEALTLIQTGKVKPLPILLFGREFWKKTVSFEALVEEGMISEEDLQLFHYVETAEEACDYLFQFYRDEIESPR